MSVTIDGGTGSVALTATASGASLGTTLIVPAGSAGAPSVVATGDTNTGVFFPAADTVALATGGSERARITSGGALLVGNTSAISSEKIQTLNTNSGAVTLAARFINGGTATSTGSRIAFSGNIGSAGSFDDIALIDGVATGTSAGALVFRTNNSGSFDERARFNATGAFVLAGGNTSANGVGITFPATQSASTDANTLDDYEEGTWTPTLSNLTFNSGSISWSGNYTKIGRVVTVNFTSSGTYSVNIGAGSTYITNLPFTKGSGPKEWGTCGNTTVTGSEGGLVADGGTSLYFATSYSSLTGIISGSIAYFV